MNTILVTLRMDAGLVEALGVKAAGLCVSRSRLIVDYVRAGLAQKGVGGGKADGGFDGGGSKAVAVGDRRSAGGEGYEVERKVGSPSRASAKAVLRKGGAGGTEKVESAKAGLCPHGSDPKFCRVGTCAGGRQ